MLPESYVILTGQGFIVKPNLGFIQLDSCQ